MYMYKITTLYPLHLHSFMCQFCLTSWEKPSRKHNSVNTKPVEIFLGLPRCRDPSQLVFRLSQML